MTPSLLCNKGFEEMSKMPGKANEIVIEWTVSRDAGKWHQVNIENII